MALIEFRDLTIGFRGPPLLDGVDCQIESGDRIGLLGRNGAGKTTLMRLLSGEVQPDHGQIVAAPQARVALLPQDVPRDMHGSIAQIVAGGLPAALREQIETRWQGEQQVEQTLDRMDLDPAAQFERLSSGMKRRVLLARAFVAQPDLLLLDEPTNHLDIESIRWLEDFLGRSDVTLLFVTHDRVFLRNLATRIWEIDGGRLFDWTCDYDTFLVRKEAALAAEEKQNALFDKRLAEEERWIRQGIKARRTRNEGRVRALKAMRADRAKRQAPVGNVQLEIQSGQRSGNLVAEVKHISFAYPDRPIVRDFSTTLMRGDKVGIIGPNGAGKTTLLRLLLGQLSPDEGGVRLGTNLQLAYFDQLREQLDPEQTIAENVGDGYDTIQLGGRSRHVIGDLQDFLFSPERTRTQVKFLSGGERNRVLLAKLFAKPANTIVLDEPTNDLDAETLEMLEERLLAFEGTVLLVSHDRAFLNNVVTSTLVFEQDGLHEYVGGYDDWQRVRQQKDAAQADNGPKKSDTRSKPGQSAPTPDRKRLSYNEQRELAGLPETIESLEQQIAALHTRMAEPDYYQRPGSELSADSTQLEELESQLATTFARWEELEARA